MGNHFSENDHLELLWWYIWPLKTHKCGSIQPYQLSNFGHFVHTQSVVQVDHINPCTTRKWPSGGQIFAWKWGFQDLRKKKKKLAQFIWNLAFNLMGSFSLPLFSCSYRQLWLCGGQIFPWKRGFWNFVAPWPSSGQSNTVIFLKT